MKVPTSTTAAKWAQFLCTPQYQMSLSIEPGTKWDVRPPYPDLEVIGSTETHVRRVVLQEVVIQASTPENQDAQRFVVRRLVAETESGEEIEISRTAVSQECGPGDTVDLQACGACGGSIPDGDAEIYNGVAYHRRCMG